jgi:hypothetical protein
MAVAAQPVEHGRGGELDDAGVVAVAVEAADARRAGAIVEADQAHRDGR